MRMSNKFEVVYRKDSQKEFIERWGKYVKRNNLPYSYLPEFINYMLSYGESIRSDESFVVIQGGETVGIAFLPIEEKKSLLRVK